MDLIILKGQQLNCITGMTSPYGRAETKLHKSSGVPEQNQVLKSWSPIQVSDLFSDFLKLDTWCRDSVKVSGLQACLCQSLLPILLLIKCVQHLTENLLSKQAGRRVKRNSESLFSVSRTQNIFPSIIRSLRKLRYYWKLGKY